MESRKRCSRRARGCSWIALIAVFALITSAKTCQALLVPSFYPQIQSGAHVPSGFRRTTHLDAASDEDDLSDGEDLPRSPRRRLTASRVGGRCRGRKAFRNKSRLGGRRRKGIRSTKRESIGFILPSLSTKEQGKRVGYASLSITPSDVGTTLTSFAKSALPAFVALYFLRFIAEGMVGGAVAAAATSPHHHSVYTYEISVYERQVFKSDGSIESTSRNTKRKFTTTDPRMVPSTQQLMMTPTSSNVRVTDRKTFDTESGAIKHTSSHYVLQNEIDSDGLARLLEQRSSFP